MILVIDNYDSFTYNLVQYLGELGQEVQVHRNDEISTEEILKSGARGVLVSPGPGRPEDAGVSMAAITTCAGKIPVLGVCLGHQAIAECFGGDVVRAPRLMHGRVSSIEHQGEGIFKGLPNPFTATRYHSLIVDWNTLPESLKVTAWTDQREIMGLRHREHPIFGVQFHPESFLTEHGHDLLRNWLEVCR